MKLSQSVKSMGMKIFTTALLAVFLFSTSSLVAVLTQQKTVQAALQQSSSWSMPYDDHIISLLRNLSDYQNFSDGDKQLLFDYFGITYAISEDELDYISAQDEQLQSALAEAILTDLLGGTISFDNISASDWERVEAYFSSLSLTQVQDMTAKGASTEDILRVNEALCYGMFSVSEAEQLLKLYPDDEERNQLVIKFHIYTINSESPVLQDAKTMLLSSVEMDKIIEEFNLEAADSSGGGRGALDENGDPIAPFSLNNGSGECVDLNTGNLNYQHNIISLSGVNGFDLNLSLVYNSINSALYNEHCDNLGNNSIVAKPIKTGLVYGWEWNLPYLETVGSSPKTLYLGNGSAYTISGHLSSSYKFSNYTLKDIVLKDVASPLYYNGQYVATYVLEYKNGDKAYFKNDGLLLAQVDRFGNTITYKYTSYNNDNVLSQIIDTAGRTVNIAYSNFLNNVRTVKVTAPDGSQTSITIETIFASNGTQYGIKKITDAKGNQTSFNYTVSAGEFNACTQKPSKAATNYWALLTSVVYPTQAKKVFSYNKYVESLSGSAYRHVYEIDNRKDVIGSIDYNIKTYKFTRSNNTVTSATMTIAGGSIGSSIVTTYAFNSNHLLTSEVVSTYKFMSQVTQLTSTAYVYNTDTLPTKVTSRVYNSSGSYTQTILLYEYDNKGNVTAFWNERANGSTSNTEYKTTFTYNSTYSLLTSKTYKQDVNTTIQESYTLTPDNKSVASAEVKVNNVLQAKTEFVYNSRGETTSQKAYKDGFVNYVETTFTYDTYGNLTSIVNTNITDVDGNLVAGTPGASSAAGRLATTFAYNNMSRLTSSTDANGNTTSYQHDILGRVTTIVNPDGTFVTKDYNDASNILTATDELGNQLKYYYDGFGNLLRIYDATKAQNLQTNTYDTHMRLSTTNNHNNSTQSTQITYTYDYFDRILTIETRDKTNVLIASETYVYDDYAENGQYRKTTHTVVGDAGAPSIVSSTYFNKSGLLEKQSRILNNVEYFDYFTYDYLGNLLTERTAIAAANGLACSAEYEYDYAGRVVKQYNVAGDFATFEYDALGKLVISTDYAGNTTIFTYDDLGRLLTQSISFETIGGTTYYSVTNYYYDSNGNIIRQQSTNNQLGQPTTYSTTEYQYNSRDWLTQATQHDGITSYYTTYTYYANGLQSSITTGNGAATTAYDYDHAGRLIELTNALGNIETYVYDTNGNLILSVDCNNWVTTYTYDGLGRVLNVNVATGNSATDCSQSFTYYLTGALKSEDNGNFSATYTYDELDRLITVSESNNVTKTYTYDIAGNRTSYILKINGVTQLSTTYTYDNFNRLETVSENGVLVATYSYDINGNRESLTYANGISEEYTYNLANMVTSVINKSGNTVISSYDYTYYLDGNQCTKTDHDGKVTTYIYDGLGRLAQESEVLSGVTQSYSYTYGTSHNRATMVASGAKSFSTSYTYDLNNRLLTETKNSATTTYIYDNNDNQLSQSTSLQINTFAYNGLNQLISANMGGALATYTYNSAGLRTSKTVGGVTTKHVWDGSNVSAELNSSNVVTAKYLRGVSLLAFDTSSARTYYLFDAHGDVVQLTNSSGVITKIYSYDTFGNETGTTQNGGMGSTDTNPFRYCGEYFDVETGNYYLRARFYSPLVGRFLSEDTHWNPSNMIYGDNPVKNAYYKDALGLSSYVPNIAAIMQSGNLYAYCGNNPVMYVDPSGNAIQFAIFGVVITGAMILSAAVSAVVVTVAIVGTFALGYVIVDGVAKLVEENKFKPITLNPAAGSPSIVTRPNTMNATRGIANVVSQPVTVANMQTKTKDFGTYQFAYLDSKGNLVKTGPQMNIAEAYYALKAMPLNGNFGGQSWGLYTSSQADAQAFALLYGLVHHSDLAVGFDAEYHGNNYYGHYHVNHIVGKEENSGVHIWFGNTLKW
ncbi:MAG: hypothetical protein FWC25_02845 [Dehalococcoidia bacterium]|nr:hypothetical protein [Dehalococcoidia bacterium]